MSKHKNYSDFYNKKDETQVTEEPHVQEEVTEVSTLEEEPTYLTESKVIETEVRPNLIIEKTAAIVKGAAKVNMRKAPSKEAAVVTVLSENTAVKILDTSNEYWFKIESGDNTGFMMSKFLKRV